MPWSNIIMSHSLLEKSPPFVFLLLLCLHWNTTCRSCFLLCMINTNSQPTTSTDSKQCCQTKLSSQIGASQHGGWSLPVLSASVSLYLLCIFSSVQGVNPNEVEWTDKSRWHVGILHINFFSLTGPIPLVPFTMFWQSSLIVLASWNMNNEQNWMSALHSSPVSSSSSALSLKDLAD